MSRQKREKKVAPKPLPDVMVLPRLPIPVVVSLATKADLTERVRRDANDALCGDGTCNRENVEELSCFAIETCKNGVPPSTRIENMFRPDSRVYMARCGASFAGCVMVAPAGGLVDGFPVLRQPCELVYNLCVPTTHRKRGVARSLMDAVVASAKVPVFLSVVRPGDATGDMWHALQTRAAGLLEAYGKMGFCVACAPTHDYMLMRYNGD